MSQPLGDYAAAVRDASYRITDRHIAELRSRGLSEAEVFETTIAAALGRALLSLNAGLDAMGQTTQPCG